MRTHVRNFRTIYKKQIRLVLPRITLPGTLSLGPHVAVLSDYNTIAKYRRCGSTQKYYAAHTSLYTVEKYLHKRFYKQDLHNN